MSDDPLSQLLSEHQNETTVLDQHLKNHIAPKIEKNNAIQEGNEKSDDDNDQPIGLVHRQPSYTSLHGNYIGKDGVKVDKLPDLTEEGEETKSYHQTLENDEPKPAKPTKKSNNSINPNNSFSLQDNVIAFDEHDDSEDVPIGLTYRQPSFASMGDHLVSKGGDSLADIVPLKTIPIEEAIIEEENDNEEDEEDEEDPQVQIVKDLKQKNKDRWLKMGYEPPPNLIQLTRAQSKPVFNQNQVFMQQPQTISPLLFSPIQEEDETPNTNLHQESSNQTSINKTTTNSNSPSNTTSTKPKIAHRRCGSNGMKLGEASTSLARMSQALMIYDSNSKLPNDNSDEKNEYDNEEEEASANEFEEEEQEIDSIKDNNTAEKEEKSKKDKKDNKKESKKHKDKEKKHKNKDKKKSKSKGKHDSEPNSYPIRDLNEKKRSYLFPSSSSSYDSDSEDNNDYYYYHHGNDELFGKLGQIVKEDQSSEVYKAILTGKLPNSKTDNYQIKHRIQQYINTCINNLWVDETEYLTKIIDDSNKYRHSHHPQQNDNYRFISHHQHHTSHPHHHRNMKSSSPVERLKFKAAEEDSNYETKIQETLLKQQHMLDMLNEEYKDAANDLDARYIIESSNRNSENEFSSNWSPSPAVLELRATIKRLLKARKYTAVQDLSSKLKKLEMEEEAEISQMIHEHYVNADRLLKEHFAMRRALLLNKIQYELQVISEERQNTAKRYSKSISRLKSLDLEFGEGFDLYDDDEGDNSDYDDYSNDIEADRFPPRISRENDEKIIELMAEKMMDLNSSSSDYDDDYEKPKKKKKEKKNKDKKKDKKKKDKKKEKKRKNKKYD